MTHTDGPRDPLGAAVEALKACRDYPVPAKVEKQVIGWAKKSPTDARAASMLLRLTYPPTVDALIRILDTATSEDELALNLANALLGVTEKQPELT